MKKLPAIIPLIILFASAISAQQSAAVDSVVMFAAQFKGIPYIYGGADPKTGFDCSGFVYYVFRQFKIEVPRASMNYERIGRIVPFDSAKKGDIIVFTGTNPTNKYPGHVGIIFKTENDRLEFIHASSGKEHFGVVVTNYLSSPGYQKRFIHLVRLRNLE